MLAAESGGQHTLVDSDALLYTLPPKENKQKRKTQQTHLKKESTPRERVRDTGLISGCPRTSSFSASRRLCFKTCEETDRNTSLPFKRP